MVPWTSAAVISFCGLPFRHSWLPGKPEHTRNWVFRESSLQIIDHISSTFEEATGRTYFHPEVQVVHGEKDGEGALVLPDGKKIQWKVDGGDSVVESTTWHPEFGKSVVNKCLVVRFESARVQIEFTW